MVTSSSSLSLTLTHNDQFAWADPEPAFFHPSSNTRSRRNTINNTKIRVFHVLHKDSQDDDLKRIKRENDRRKRRKISPLLVFKVQKLEIGGDDKGTSGRGSNDENDAYNDVGIELKADHRLPFKYVRQKVKKGKNKEDKEMPSPLRRIWPIFDKIVKSLISKDSENLDNEALALFLAIPKRNTYATMQVPFIPPGFSKETLFEECCIGFQTLLPPTDCESKKSMKVTMSYHNFWRPKKVRCIILGESHVYTNEDVATKGHIVSTEWVSTSEYEGPRDFTSFVNCLGYGESEILVPREEGEEEEEDKYAMKNVASRCRKVKAAKGKAAKGKGMKKTLKADSKITTNKGTPQYWQLLLHLSGLNPKDVPILKKQISSTKGRIRNKLKILRALKERGVWLLDTSIIGWYIQQEKQYAVSPQDKNIYDFCKERPPNNLKTPRYTLTLVGILREAFGPPGCE